MTPRIVVTTARGDAATEYVEALRAAGGEPIVASAVARVGSVLDGAAGLLLTGGADVDPALYDAAPSPLIAHTDRPRDEFEIAVLREARERALPTFCICRGLQVANVAFGGTLVPDIPAALGARATIAHRAAGPDGKTLRGLVDAHVVAIEPASRLAEIVGVTALHTGSRHHQSADRIAPELRVVARTADGIVEALEARFPSPFWLAVQWHPESTRALDAGASDALFRAFVEATGRSRAGSRAS